MRARATRLLTGGLLLTVLAIVVFLGLCCGIRRGKFETVEYDFQPALSGKQRIVVYLPPDYPHKAPYPTLYLLHGAGDDETGWREEGSLDTLLGRLSAKNKIVDMIVVMPNWQGRGGAFERDLLEKVIPYVESHYATQDDREHQAIVGTSMGGWLALRIGLNHPDRFAWVGGVSPSMDDVLPAHYSGRLKLLWLSTGDRDQCKTLSESLHRTFEKRKIPHVWQVLPGEHDWPLWRDTLQQLAPLLFRDE
jgi:enterochelin esterase-like enzyme